MSNPPPSGKGSRTKPVTLAPPVLVPNLTEHDRATVVAALTDIQGETACAKAMKLQRDGRVGDAIRVWQTLFGPTFAGS